MYMFPFERDRERKRARESCWKWCFLEVISSLVLCFVKIVIDYIVDVCKAFVGWVCEQ